MDSPFSAVGKVGTAASLHNKYYSLSFLLVPCLMYAFIDLVSEITCYYFTEVLSETDGLLRYDIVESLLIELVC